MLSNTQHFKIWRKTLSTIQNHLDASTTASFHRIGLFSDRVASVKVGEHSLGTRSRGKSAYWLVKGQYVLVPGLYKIYFTSLFSGYSLIKKPIAKTEWGIIILHINPSCNGLNMQIDGTLTIFTRTYNLYWAVVSRFWFYFIKKASYAKLYIGQYLRVKNLSFQ